MKAEFTGTIPAISQPVCVLGMHRSGTSVIAGALHRLGVDMGPPERLLRATQFNEKGHWEHKDLMEISNMLFRRLGGRWYRPPYFEPGWDQARKLSELAANARAVIARDFAHAEVWGWKDPRACLALPFWRRLVPEPRFVVCLRDPAEVSASLTKRDGLRPAKGVYLWLRYTAEALRHTHEGRRAVFVYEDFVADWREETERLGQIAGVDPAATLKDFVDPSLRHHRASDVDLRANGAGPETIDALTVARTLYGEVRAGRAPNPAETSLLLADGIERLIPELKRLQSADEPDRRAGAALLRDEIDARVPDGEAVALIADGALHRELCTDGRVIPFSDGWLDLPPDDAAAIAELERVRRAGVRFVALAWPARWWLDLYSGFRAHLQRRWRVVKDTDRATLYEALPGGSP